ncbi:hypothetical protein [Ornithinimicrobium flavum]|uniref:hypothetical protein n=1 Tax=Ornithinimicrobium flavum TaxID=1288636 RepID=UPI0010701DC0|nr:hypothetical protein [Ornithinimicrobium flavum]
MRDRLTVLTQTFAALGEDAPQVGLVTLGDVQEQQEAAAAVETARGELRGVLDLGQVALDPRAERMFHGEPVRRPETTMLVRSGRSLVERLVAAVGPVRSAPADGIPGSAERPAADTPDATAVPAPDATPTTTADATPGTATDPAADAAPAADVAGTDAQETRAERRSARRKWRIGR